MERFQLISASTVADLVHKLNTLFAQSYFTVEYWSLTGDTVYVIIDNVIPYRTIVDILDAHIEDTTTESSMKLAHTA